MTNDELKKILEWVEKKGEFVWNDLHKQFRHDEKMRVLAENALRSNMPQSSDLVDHLYVSGQDPNILVLTTRGRSVLAELKNQTSPLTSAGLLVLTVISKALDYFDFISTNLFWIILGVIVVTLLFLYWRTRNAVWGGLTIGLIVGVVISVVPLFGGGSFDGYIIVKGAIIGTILGLVAELLGKISDYLRRK